jgi:hypothetical protein
MFYFSFRVLSFFTLLFFTFAPKPSFSNELETFVLDGRFPVANIYDVQKHVMTRIEKGKIKPEELLVIFDVHGTLSDEPTPKPEHVKLRPRTNAIEFVYYLVSMKIKRLAASAWPWVEQVEQGLIDLGLQEAFQIEIGKRQHAKYYEIRPHARFDIPVTYVRNGGLVSVELFSDVVPEKLVSYRAKALTPYIALSPADLLHLKEIIFIDDRKSNVQAFRDMVDQYHLFRFATVEGVSALHTIQVSTIQLLDKHPEWAKEGPTTGLKTPEPASNTTDGTQTSPVDLRKTP